MINPAAMTGGNEKSKLHFTSQGESDLLVVRQTAKNLADQIARLQETVKELKGSIQEDQDTHNQARTQFTQRAIRIRRASQAA